MSRTCSCLTILPRWARDMHTSAISLAAAIALCILIKPARGACGKAGALADEQGGREAGCMHGTRQPLPQPPGRTYGIVECKEFLIQSHNAKFH